MELCKSRRETREEINIEGFDFSGNGSMSRILLSEIPTLPGGSLAALVEAARIPPPPTLIFYPSSSMQWEYGANMYHL